MDRSAERGFAVTVVPSVSELLALLGSDVDEETVAVLLRTPLAGAVPVIVMTPTPPEAMPPRVHVIDPDAGGLQVHPVPEPVAPVSAGGSVSTTPTLDAVLGPALVTVRV